ncbi:adaptin family protein [Cryptosporidium felis]|nr:adaptin family protein [Cryptosporidium felis]
MQYVDSFSTRQLFDLVKSIGECRSKFEEDIIILNESGLLKAKMMEHTLSSNKLREYMIRAIYIEMLGHDASFAYIHAIKMSNDKNILVKRIGYLACCIFLNNNHELLVLLINTIQRDLESKNQLDVSAALSCLPSILNFDILSSIENSLLKLLSHQTPAIRRKAYLLMIIALEIKPSVIDEKSEILIKGLCDVDISVKNSALYLINYLSLLNPKMCIPLIPQIVTILKQVIDNNAPKEYDYHLVPAPWTQINILQTLSKVASFEKETGDQIYEIILSTIKRIEQSISILYCNGKLVSNSMNLSKTNNAANISFAILESCIQTIASLYPNKILLDQAEEIIPKFFHSEINYLKYIGMKCLSKITTIDPTYAIPYQFVVVDCLEDKDETIRRCTLELLCRMTNPQNVEVIISKLITQLKCTSDIHFREELVRNIVNLTEKFAPSYRWYLNTMVNIIELTGKVVGRDKANNIAQIIAEGPTGNENTDHEFRTEASRLFCRLLDEKVDELPEILYNLGIWVIGEYGICFNQENGSTLEEIGKIFEVTELLHKIFQKLKRKIRVCQNDIGLGREGLMESQSLVKDTCETISMIVLAIMKCYSYIIMVYKKITDSEINSSNENELNDLFFLEKINFIYNELINDCSLFPYPLIYQRSKEFLSIIQLNNKNQKLSTNLNNKCIDMLNFVLPFDASCEELYVDRGLGFLDDLVLEYRLSEKYQKKKNNEKVYDSILNGNFEEVNYSESLRKNEPESLEIFSWNGDTDDDPNNNLGSRSIETPNVAVYTNQSRSSKSNSERTGHDKMTFKTTFSADYIDKNSHKYRNTKSWGPEGFVKREQIQCTGHDLDSQINGFKKVQNKVNENKRNQIDKQREANALFNGINSAKTIQQL